jgi:hypothetical protein
MVYSDPVFIEQTLDQLEFPKVVTDESEAITARMGSDVKVIHTNRCATALQAAADLLVILSRFRFVIEYIEPAAEILHRRQGDVDPKN